MPFGAWHRLLVMKRGDTPLALPLLFNPVDRAVPAMRQADQVRRLP
jgi:hypothetical protein